MWRADATASRRYTSVLLALLLAKWYRPTRRNTWSEAAPPSCAPFRLTCATETARQWHSELKAGIAAFAAAAAATFDAAASARLAARTHRARSDRTRSSSLARQQQTSERRVSSLPLPRLRSPVDEGDASTACCRRHVLDEGAKSRPPSFCRCPLGVFRVPQQGGHRLLAANSR